MGLVAFLVQVGYARELDRRTFSSRNKDSVKLSTSSSLPTTRFGLPSFNNWRYTMFIRSSQGTMTCSLDVHPALVSSTTETNKESRHS